MTEHRAEKVVSGAEPGPREELNPDGLSSLGDSSKLMTGISKKKSPHLTEVSRVAQHVHVEQLGQVVRSPPVVGLSELGPNGRTLPLDDSPLLTLGPGRPDRPDHLLQGH